MHVVTRAMEIPPARSDGLAAPSAFAIVLNERIIPVTVPSNPSIGLVDAMNDRYSSFRYNFDTSRSLTHLLHCILHVEEAKHGPNLVQTRPYDLS